MNSYKQKILFISPTWVDIHRDIAEQLGTMGYEVTFIPENSFPEDPYRIKGKKITVSDSVVESLKKQYWDRNYAEINRYYDYLIVIDGQGINDHLFSILRASNPNIHCVNYLYDTTHSVYHFEENFKYFDKIFTFDRQESEKYNIDLLPIYWTPIDNNGTNLNYEIFGFGSYSKNRFELYKFIKGIAENLGKETFIQIYHNKIKNKLLHILNNCLRKLKRENTLISLTDYKSELVTHTLLPTAEFRKIIQTSNVVIDSKVLDQDGLTARFMWALGAEKKIITTNTSAKLYPFYSKDQILILDESIPLENQKTKVIDFLATSTFEMTSRRKDIIKNLRIDNWVNTLLSR